MAPDFFLVFVGKSMIRKSRTRQLAKDSEDKLSEFELVQPCTFMQNGTSGHMVDNAMTKMILQLL